MPRPRIDRLSDARKLSLVLAFVATCSAALGFLGAHYIRSPQQVLADSAPPPHTVLTAPVEVGILDRSVVRRGTVEEGSAEEIKTGTEPAVVTARPIAIGGRVHSGQVAVEVADRPLFVLEGKIPMLRDLHAGDTGEDVARLQAGLREAGWPVVDREGDFGWSTAGALRRMYARSGYDSPTMPASTDAPRETPSDAEALPQDRRELDSAEGSIEARVNEIAFISHLPARIVAVGAQVGRALDGAAVKLSMSSPTVSFDVDPATAEDLARGQRVQISGSFAGAPVSGRIRSVGNIVSTDAGMTSTIRVRPAAPLPESAVGDDVQVTVDLNKGEAEGLIVPVSAIVADSSGRTSVQKLNVSAKETVKVRVLESSDGRCRIAVGRGELVAGDKVVVGAG